MIRVAAVGDVHFSADARGRLRPALKSVVADADVLLVAGDLTCLGTVAEANALAEELHGLDVPTFAVLGNHDHHSDAAIGVTSAMSHAGIHVLEGDSCVVHADAGTIGIAGVKGFGGGFVGASGSEFGEPEMRSFIAHTRSIAQRLRQSLLALATDVRIALLHYSPVADTLEGERLEIYPFLGSHLLADAIDEAGADLVVHGHAHGGVEEGMTPGGVPVRNVAQPVLGRPVARYLLADGKVLTEV